MTAEYQIILVIVTIFSFVQSLFGMGLLVFGTPTLLLIGYDFFTALGYLLPASFAISLLQVLSAGENRVPISRYLYILCFPAIGLGLFLTETSPLVSWTNKFIGWTLLVSALIRFWPPSRKLLTEMLEKHFPAYHFIMGLIHGLTNLGGALLAILASGINTDKEATRYTIAYYYLTFSIIQMLVLTVVMGHQKIDLMTAVVSAVVYLFIGNRIFIRISNQFYGIAMTAFTALYGIAVLLKS